MKHQKPFKTKLKADALQALYSLIEALLQTNVKDDDDKLLFAALAEIKHRLYMKMDTPQREYQISLSPTHAFALRILSTCYVHDNRSYLGNKLHSIANEVHKHYS
ncbi:MAG: hypothetical protein JSR11_07770 [Bacteroidetes bacterium]|nr:hypothetical protein [Bacteroidota bacterium]